MNKKLEGALWTGAGVMIGLVGFAVVTNLGLTNFVSNTAVRARALLPV